MRGMSAALQTPPKYSRRRPELTPCYKILQGHLDTFIAEREAEGRPLPDYIKEEFEAYMRCGIPAFGFLRLKCKSCEEEIFVALDCNSYYASLLIVWKILSFSGSYKYRPTSS